MTLFEGARIIVGDGATVIDNAAFVVEGSRLSAVAGVVRDSIGGVPPGVTVEAASEVLIEKSRVATTDGQLGPYRSSGRPIAPAEYRATLRITR